LAEDGRAALTTSHESSGPQIPDFEKDAASLAAYDDARLRYERREASDAENKTRSTFNQRRDAIRAEIAVAASLLEERRIKATKALQAYAARYPHRIDRNKPVKPTFWESFLSLGRASRLYKGAIKTAADALSAQSLRRRKEHDEEELEQQLKRALYLNDEALKKRLESPEGLAQFHARPGVAVLFKRVEEIRAERAAYAARLERNEVSPIEQRDREFAERKITQLEAPFDAAMIVRIQTWCSLSYFLLRDLERKLYHLTYDARLEPLLETVFDVYRIVDSFEVKAHRGADGRPFTILDHLTAVYKDEEKARSEFRRIRTAQRQPRDLSPMTVVDPAEQTLLDLLAVFARTAGLSSSTFGAGPVQAPATPKPPAPGEPTS
jgi:hypothetical protein